MSRDEPNARRGRIFNHRDGMTELRRFQMSELPEWIHNECPDAERLVRALSIAWEALEDIRNHQKILMKDSGLAMSTTYRLSEKALRRIEELGE